MKVDNNTEQTETLKPQTETAKAPPSQRQNLQKLWMALLAVVIIFVALIFDYFIKIRNSLKDFSENVEGSFQELLFYGTLFGTTYGIIEMVVHYVLDPLTEKYYLTQTKYFTREARSNKSFTMVKFGFTFFYYCISSYWAFCILRESNYIPWWLGGTGQCRNMFQGFPKMSGNLQEIKIFYWIQFGKHMARFMMHAFIRPEGKYFEYTLHHGLANFLILFSYVVNCWNVGVFILFVHDLSDAFLIVPRFLKQAKWKLSAAKAITVLIALFVWIATRLIAFPFCCISAVIDIVQTYVHGTAVEHFSMLVYPAYFFIFLLLGLVLMHVVWTYYLLRSVVQYAISSKLIKHNYD